MDSEIEGLNSKHLTAGSPEPPKKDNGKIRIYNMRFCPYGQRGLLGLRLKGVPFEVVNINLNQKPEWYLEKKNPLGKVPTIDHDGKIVYESLVCVDYLNENFKTGRKFVPEDSYERAKQRMLTERLTALPSALYPYYRNRNDEAAMKKIEDAFQFYESLLQQDYFAGNQPGYADFMSWPWIERLSAVEIMSEGRLVVNPEKYPKFAAYIERMRTIPEIKTFLLDGPTHAKFLEGVSAGKIEFDNIL